MQLEIFGHPLKLTLEKTIEQFYHESAAALFI
jgi:hypothetical protein